MIWLNNLIQSSYQKTSFYAIILHYFLPLLTNHFISHVEMISKKKQIKLRKVRRKYIQVRHSPRYSILCSYLATYFTFPTNDHHRLPCVWFPRIPICLSVCRSLSPFFLSHYHSINLSLSHFSLTINLSISILLFVYQVTWLTSQWVKDCTVWLTWKVLERVRCLASQL